MASASLINNFPIIKQVFEDIYTLGLEPDHYSYSIIMHAFARHGQAQTVQELFDTYVKTGRKPDIYMYAELLYVQYMLLDIAAVERTFESIKEAGLDSEHVIYDMMTAAYTRTLDVDGSMRVFREYLRRGNEPTEYMIAHLIGMFANRNDTEAAVEMFNLLGEFKIAPKVGSFNQLLNAYANTGDHVNAEAVIAKMRQLGIKPDVVTWTTLMKLYVEKDDTYAVVDVLARMRRGKIQPSEVTWAQLLELFTRRGGPNAIENSRRVMNRVKSLGMKLDVFHWNSLLQTTIKTTRDLRQMQQVYDEMLDNGIKPNTVTHGILISAYCQYGGRSGLEIAEGIVSRLNSISQYLDLTSRMSPRTALSPALFTPIFKVQGPKLPLEEVQKVFDGYLNSTASIGGTPAEPDLQFLVPLLNIYRQHRDIQAVQRVWLAIKTHADNASRSFRSSTSEGIREFVVPGNRYLLSSALSHYILALSDAEQLDEIDAVWDQLSYDGYDFDNGNWNTRIKICLIKKKHIVWAFRACEEVLMDGWEIRLRKWRKKPRNPPQSIRDMLQKREDHQMLNRIFWPIEDDLMDITPPKGLERDNIPKSEYYPFSSTLYEFVTLRRELLRGTSIIDSSGRRRPGPEVWERLKQAFPRIVRAMFLQLKRMSKSDRYKVMQFEMGNSSQPRNSVNRQQRVEVGCRE
jgi:pentatricopeptide repeat protein